MEKSFTVKFIYYEPLFDPQNHILPFYHEVKKMQQKNNLTCKNVLRFHMPMIYDEVNHNNGTDNEKTS